MAEKTGTIKPLKSAQLRKRQMRGLFGGPSPGKKRRVLEARFLYPPFSILNAREGWWQERKRQWLALGIKSEVGRGALLCYTDQPGLDRIMADKSCPGGTPRPAMNYKNRERGAGDGKAIKGTQAGARNARGDLTFATADYFEEKGLTGPASGTSVFDPVLCELMYSWFCPPGGQIIDPFAGGSVRGITAAIMGRNYWGSDLSKPQIVANREQAVEILGNGGRYPIPKWVCGDSTIKIKKAPGADFLFTCHPANVRVHLASGLSRIADIRLGDKVLTHTGAYRSVTELLKRSYSGTLYSFCRDYHSVPLRATAEHPFLIKSTPHSKPKWKRAAQVCVGDYLLEPVPKAPISAIDGECVWQDRVKLKLHQRGQASFENSQVKATAALCRLAGYYLAEGSTSGGSTSFAFSKDETEYHQDVISCHTSVFEGANKRQVYKWDKSTSRGVTVQCFGIHSARFFRSLGQGASHKRFPLWIWNCSDDLLANMIVGCWRGDGWISKCGKGEAFGYCSVSRNLVDDIRRGLLRLGIIASLRLRRPRLGGKSYLPNVIKTAKPQWHLSVKGVNADKLAGLLGITIDVPKWRRPGRGPFIANGYAHYKIRDISAKQVENFPVFNIEVADDHSYLANGVCSHNCPPYGSLEQYSEDERDLSAMEDADFEAGYAKILRRAVARLHDDRFAAIVVGAYRSKQSKTGAYVDLAGITVRAMQAAGMEYYNEAVLVTAVGSLPVRATLQFNASRKLGRSHQNILIFCKGDPKAAAKACKAVELKLRSS